ncbi:ABC-2 type transport system ATP-binding protein [Herbihabitans rhizosphaerae]|uniref:ABC-2 type transport system ATP-binding protein n=1 Tax=Herbihabitans rhizosphaerae TaxID=1872711 RepID=A0A4Q7KQ51_9PSEU|nr:ATP-binding cassette domain-containing protein [Herbihabitans rhizosphaerae]RZS38929.1 ABC-2 type transport system ATP-binding protein [Herbihabitans rhizosphaerae]
MAVRHDQRRAPEHAADTIAPAIQARELVKTYNARGADPVHALGGISFSVEQGTVFGLLGPNGAGKSTTVKILTTLTTPTSGTATVAGHDVLRHPDRVRRGIGVVTQGHSTAPEATGRENLLLAGRIHGLRGQDVHRRADELLGTFGLTDAANRIVKTYSGGMQRKLDVALGLMHRPAVLFLDEPTTGLDPQARAEMWAEISRLSAEEGLTILLTTHYLEEADRLASQLAIVDSGRLITTGTPEQLKSELRGDAVVAEIAPESEISSALQAIERLDGTRESTVDGRTVRARVDHGASAVPRVLAALESAGVGVASITVARPSLDDVYLRHTGRTFASAEDGGAR